MLQPVLSWAYGPILPNSLVDPLNTGDREEVEGEEEEQDEVVEVEEEEEEEEGEDELTLIILGKAMENDVLAINSLKTMSG